LDAFRRIKVIFTVGGARGRGWKVDTGGGEGTRLAPRGGKKGAGWNLDASSDFALGWSGEGKGN